MTATIFGCPNLEGFEPLAFEDGLTFRKELVYEGTFEKDGQKFPLTKATFDDAVKSHREFTKNGNEVPVPEGHNFDSSVRRGSLLDLEVGKNSKGLWALFGKVQFKDQEAAKLAKTTQVSIFLEPSFTDGKGKKYSNLIRHVALTDYPVVPGLEKFEALAASFIGDEKMPLKSLGEKLGLNFAEDDKDEDMEEKIVQAFKKKDDELKAAQDDEEEKKKKMAKEEEEKNKPVSAAYLSMLRENRQGKIDKLVGEHRITPAVGKKLSSRYCADDRCKVVLSQEGFSDDFDDVIGALAENEPMKLDNEETGQQVVELSADKNPLMKDAERRAKAAR